MTVTLCRTIYTWVVVHATKNIRRGKRIYVKKQEGGHFYAKLWLAKEKKNLNPVYFADAAQDLVFFTEKIHCHVCVGKSIKILTHLHIERSQPSICHQICHSSLDWRYNTNGNKPQSWTNIEPKANLSSNIRWKFLQIYLLVIKQFFFKRQIIHFNNKLFSI